VDIRTVELFPEYAAFLRSCNFEEEIPLLIIASTELEHIQKLVQRTAVLSNLIFLEMADFFLGNWHSLSRRTETLDPYLS